MTAPMPLRGRRLQPRRVGWYPKTAPTTFMDAPALVRMNPWTDQPPLPLSQPSPDMAKPPLLSPEYLWDFFCYTA